MEKEKTNTKTIDDILAEAFKGVFEERKKNGVIERFDHTPESRAAFAKELENYIQAHGLARDLELAKLRKKLNDALENNK